MVHKVLQHTLIAEAHDAITAGHLGISRTYERIKDRYYIPGCVEAIARFVKSCESCQHKNSPSTKTPGYLQPLPVKRPFVGFHIDFTAPFPITARRNQYIVLGICLFTKYVIAEALPAAAAANAAKYLAEDVILKHGMIEELLTDRGSHFTGTVMQQVIELLSVKHLRTSSYHPQCDGQAERAIQTFFRIVSHYLNENQKNWDLPFYN